MGNSNDIKYGNTFYRQLFYKAFVTVTIVSEIAIWNVWFIDKKSPFSWLSTLVLALLETILIVRLTCNQLSKVIGQSHLLSYVLILFGILIGLIVISFATDYVALYLMDSNNFETTLQLGDSTLIIFFEFLYFSLITFLSVGFGDIVPIAFSSKLLVMLEVVLSFFVLVFGLANINRIHVNNK